MMQRPWFGSTASTRRFNSESVVLREFSSRRETGLGVLVATVLVFNSDMVQGHNDIELVIPESQSQEMVVVFGGDFGYSDHCVLRGK